MSSWGNPAGFFLGSRPWRPSRLRALWRWLTERRYPPCCPHRSTDPPRSIP